MTTSDDSATEFELTIDGGLGPVLRHALGPDVEVQTHTCTTLLAESSVDLGTLVELLHARGLSVESVFIVRPGVATLAE